MTLPEGEILPSVARLFWNVAPGALDTERSAALIMRTVLASGELEDARWLLRTYGRERVSRFLLEDTYGRRELPRGARKLWAIILRLDIPAADLEGSQSQRWTLPARSPGSRAFTERPGPAPISRSGAARSSGR